MGCSRLWRASISLEVSFLRSRSSRTGIVMVSGSWTGVASADVRGSYGGLQACAGRVVVLWRWRVSPFCAGHWPYDRACVQFLFGVRESGVSAVSLSRASFHRARSFDRRFRVYDVSDYGETIRTYKRSEHEEVLDALVLAGRGAAPYNA